MKFISYKKYIICKIYFIFLKIVSGRHIYVKMSRKKVVLVHIFAETIHTLIYYSFNLLSKTSSNFVPELNLSIIVFLRDFHTPDTQDVQSALYMTEFNSNLILI